MTLLHTSYTSGTQLTDGDIGGVIGLSGLNNITGRINFGGYDFPQSSNISFTSGTANEIITATYIGENHSYTQTVTYNAEINPLIIVISGTSIGSVVRYDFYYGTGSGTTSTGGLVAGSISIT